jgi:hypothetical protein
MPDYPEAFGLHDNPFGPRLPFGNVPPPLTVELENRPLFVHLNEDLDALYCQNIPSFEAACNRLNALLKANGYKLDPPTRGVSSYLIAIDGDRGAGKTTLASQLMRQMLKRTPSGASPWRVEELRLKAMTQTPSKQIELLKAFETNVLAAKAQYNCILVDELLADAFHEVTQVYDNLRNECVVFMVFTSFDPKMAEQLDRSLRNVQRYSIAPLTPDDAIAYVKARYQVFRLPAVNGLSALPLFPFDADDIRTAVQVRAFRDNNTTGPVNLRLIASILESNLSEHLQDLDSKDPNFNVNNAPSAQLLSLQINVAQSYSSVLRK